MSLDQTLAALTETARARPDDVALVEGETALSFAAFDAAVDRLAHLIAARGAGPGDVLGWVGPTGIERTVFVVAANRAGCGTACPDPRTQDGALAAMLRSAAPRAVLCDAGSRARLAGLGDWDRLEAPDPRAPGAGGAPFAPVAAPPDAPANLRYTSGSTGAPKAVAVTRAIEDHFDRLAFGYSGIGPRDVQVLPGHLWTPALFSALIGGARMAFLDPARLGGAALAEAFAAAGGTLIMTYPAIFRQIVAAGRALPTWRSATLAGEAVTRADLAAFDAVAAPGAELHVTFGLNEFAWVARSVHRSGAPSVWDVVPIGRPTDPDGLRLIAEDGREARPGQAGEIEIVSRFLPEGYRGDPASAARFPVVGPQGLRAFRTGDMAWRDGDGVLHGLGRRDEQVKIRGYNVRPTEIEPLLEAMPGVREAAVTAADGAHGTRRLRCHYAGEAAAEDLRAALAARLPDYMVPTVWRRVEALPRTSTGKIRRQAMPEAAPEIGSETGPRNGPGFDRAWRDGRERVFAELFAELLEHEAFGRDDDFFDLGGDSLQAMALATQAERRMGRRLPLETLILGGASVAALSRAWSAQEASDGAAVRLRRAAGPDGEAQGALVLAPPASGHLSAYLSMVHALGSGREVLGLHPAGLGGEAPARTIEGIARHCVDRLRAAGGGGGGGNGDANGAGRGGGRAPGALVGFSYGAFVAVEMARILGREDGATPPLVLIDPDDPRPARRVLARLGRAFRRDGTSGLASRAARFAAEGAGAAPSAMEAAHRRAGLRYAPGPLQARALILTSAEERPAQIEAMAWRALLGEATEIRAMPGDHGGMMRGAEAGLVAQAVRTWLARKEGART